MMAMTTSSSIKVKAQSRGLGLKVESSLSLDRAAKALNGFGTTLEPVYLPVLSLQVRNPAEGTHPTFFARWRLLCFGALIVNRKRSDFRVPEECLMRTCPPNSTFLPCCHRGTPDNLAQRAVKPPPNRKA
jgi:hypothetical protein